MTRDDWRCWREWVPVVRVGEITLGDVLMVTLLPPRFAGIVAFAFRPGLNRRLPVLVAAGVPMPAGWLRSDRVVVPRPRA